MGRRPEGRRNAEGSPGSSLFSVYEHGQDLEYPHFQTHFKIPEYHIDGYLGCIFTYHMYSQYTAHVVSKMRLPIRFPIKKSHPIPLKPKDDTQNPLVHHHAHHKHGVVYPLINV